MNIHAVIQLQVQVYGHVHRLPQIRYNHKRNAEMKKIADVLKSLQISRKNQIIIIILLTALIFTGVRILMDWLTIQQVNVSGRYLKNSDDSDTVRINVKTEITALINGVEASAKNKKLIRNICENAEKLEFRNMRFGYFFRVIADIYVDGENLADILNQTQHFQHNALMRTNCDRDILDLHKQIKYVKKAMIIPAMGELSYVIQ